MQSKTKPNRDNDLMLTAMLLWTLIGALLVVSTLGCQTEVKGGQAKQTQTREQSMGGSQNSLWQTLTFIIGPDGQLKISVDTSAKATTQPTTSSQRTEIATTQPSIKTTQNVLPKIGEAGVGEIAPIVFSEMTEQIRVNARRADAWGVAGLFIAIAAAFYWVGRKPLAAIACVFLALLAILKPEILIFAAIGALAWLAWSMRHVIKQLVSGTENLKNRMSLDAENRGLANTLMEAKHDEATKRVVKAVKGE